MKLSFTPPLSNAVTGARNHNMKKLNAQEMLNNKQEEVNEKKKVVADIGAKMDKTTDGITYRYLEAKLHSAENDLRILENELKECRTEVADSRYQERKARTSLLVENNAVQRAADMIMNDEFAQMEAEFSSAAKKRSGP